MTRVMVLGLDGGTLDLVEPWMKAGKLPALQALAARGSYGPLRSVMPVLSSAAWASFMTGLNPGKHGVYDFVQRDLNTYRRHLVQGNAVHGRSLWRLLGEAGRRVGVMNVPMTYPLEPVNGFLVSGLGTPDYKPFAYPPELQERLQAQGYRVNKRLLYKPGEEEAFLEEVYRITDLQAGTALELARAGEWDFFMFVFRDTDELPHFFWRFMDETHPAYDPAGGAHYGDAMLRYYQRVDEWVGRFLELAGPETDVIVISDHGSGPLYKEVMLNEWLRQEGFLVLRQQVATASASRRTLARLGIHRQMISRVLRALKLGRVERLIKDLLGERIGILPESVYPELSEIVDWNATRAYSFGYQGHIYVNLRGREGSGAVAPDDYERVCDEIIAALRRMVDPEDGQPVVTAAYRKEELFGGPYLQLAPDITVIMRGLAYITRKGYEFAEASGSLFYASKTGESGSHREEGLLFAAGPSLAARGRVDEMPSLMDIAPTVLHLMGCPVPAEMDGHVLADWLAERARLRPVEVAASQERPAEPAAEAPALTNEEEDAMLERLRNLGYVE